MVRLIHQYLDGCGVAGSSLTESIQSVGSNFILCFVLGLFSYVLSGLTAVCRKQPGLNITINMTIFAMEGKNIINLCNISNGRHHCMEKPLKSSLTYYQM